MSAYNTEKDSWALPHRLNVDVTRRENDLLPLIDKFGPMLCLCYQERNLMSIDYQHWFVKDKISNWTIEFAGGIGNNHVNIHCNPLGVHDLDMEFANTALVKQRMRNVCGTTNYSLALRNCEHISRYIQAGVWVSFQTIPKSIIMKKFVRDLAEKTKLINTFPEELKPPNESFSPIFTGISDFIYCGGPKDALTAKDQKAFNILVFGPTGAGKSTIINHLYNKFVCPISAGPRSETRRVHYTQGQFYFKNGEKKGKGLKNVNIIDTIGLCDSMLTDKEVHTFINESLKINLMHIDKVLVVCFDRITPPHVESIQQFLELLQFKKHKSNFVFVYSKCDGASEEEREENLETMVDMLDNDADEDDNQPDKITTALPPGSELTEEIEANLTNLKNIILSQSSKRISVDKKFCNIM